MTTVKFVFILLMATNYDTIYTCMDQVISFLRESKEEFLRVTWPTRQETIRLTFVVIIISVVIGLFVGGLDFLFTNVMNALFRR